MKRLRFRFLNPIENKLMKNLVNLLIGQKLKHPFFKDSVEYYIQKLTPYCHIHFMEAKNEDRFKVLCDQYAASSFLITLEETGKEFSSIELAKKLEPVIFTSKKEVTFAIGGPYGFSKHPNAKMSLSLSKLTLNHEMVPELLLEQLYRSYMILHKKPYHHA